MNWDWDKLQEKRQRQGKTTPPPPPPGGDGPENPFEGFRPGKYVPNFFKGRFRAGPALVLALVLWLASGIFIVNPGEVGVILRFGKFDREVKDGPHYRLPFPIESSIIINTELLRTIEIGISADNAKRASQVKAEESSMFTGDENIVHMQFNVQYNIDNARNYLFNVRDPVTIITGAAEAAMREVVGRSNIDAILTSGRAVIQTDAMDVLNGILDAYTIGVRIHTVQLLDVQPPSEVEAAFKDVASAREDRVRFINQAEAYRNEIVPVANGTAMGMLNAAKAYAQQIEQAASGEAGRFLAMVTEFNQAEDITRKRLYLETMEEVFSSSGMEKIIMSHDGQGGILPFLNMDRSAAPTRPPVQPARPTQVDTPANGAAQGTRGAR
jgi:membrane protease subunit HflK